MSKENKILLVLGGSSDMGMSLIRKVASQYDTVLAQYRTLSEDLSLLQKELGDRLICLPADFSDKDSTKKFIANIVEQRLFPDHIVHFSAPKFKNIKFAKSSWDDFENGFQISLHSLYETLCAFLPYMKKQHYGRVIVAFCHLAAKICLQNTCLPMLR